MPRRRRRPLRATAIVVVAALGLTVGLYFAFRKVQQITNGCQANSGASAVSLDTEQGAIAATIAGVAHNHRLAAGAVTIAYATAMQESHMHNLTSGDLDSVGVFQQRPSQGWGSARQLTDPVYATGRFFDALVKVPDYLHIPLAQAAQDVQHSADGSAYENYQSLAAGMATAFTGEHPHAVWCWFYPRASGAPELGAAGKSLRHAFGRLDVAQAGGSGGDPADDVRVSHRAEGWAVASWLVTHATEFRISNVRYAGYQWSASDGNHGWTRDPAAPSGSVEVR